MAQPRQRVFRVIASVTVLVGFGTIGYRAIEGWPWFECFYMTLITLATIGYEEPEGITQQGRYFTAVLIVSGVWIFAFAVSALAQIAIQSELLAGRRKRRVQERIRKLERHLIICGGGRVGLAVARGLEAEGVDFVLVEIDRAHAEALVEDGRLALQGDARDEEILKEAGIERARGLVCALPTDADNVFVVLTARDLASPGLYIVARVNDEATVSKMLKAGANKIVSPIGTGARQILQSLLRPNVAQFMELATMKGQLDLIVEEVVVAEGSTLAGRTLAEADLRKTLDVIVVALLPKSGEMVFNPKAETRVEAGDTLIVIGNHAGINGLETITATARTR